MSNYISVQTETTLPFFAWLLRLVTMSADELFFNLDPVDLVAINRSVKQHRRSTESQWERRRSLEQDSVLLSNGSPRKSARDANRARAVSEFVSLGEAARGVTLVDVAPAGDAALEAVPEDAPKAAPEAKGARCITPETKLEGVPGSDAALKDVSEAVTEAAALVSGNWCNAAPNETAGAKKLMEN